MNGCTFPGRMISWAGVVCFGDTTDTAVVAICEVSAFNVARALTRDQIPDPMRAAVTASAIPSTTHRLYECRREALVQTMGGAGGAAVTASAIPSTTHRLYECFPAATFFNSGDCPPTCFTSSV